MTFGSIVVLIITATMVAICVKVRSQSRKIQELEELMRKE